MAHISRNTVQFNQLSSQNQGKSTMHSKNHLHHNLDNTKQSEVVNTPQERQYNFKTISRLSAIQALYLTLIHQQDLHQSDSQILDLYLEPGVIWEDSIKIKTKHHKDLIIAIDNNLSTVQDMIAERLVAPWSLANIHPLLMSHLVCGICDMIYLQSPTVVVINEITNIGNSMLTEGEVKFVNSLLDSVAKQQKALQNNNLKQDTASHDNKSDQAISKDLDPQHKA